MIPKQHKMAAHQIYKTGDELNKVATVFFLVGQDTHLQALSPHPFYSPSTQGSIIHSTVVGAGPCLSCSVVTMCWEARSSRNRKVR